jgi:hypothetical protein
MDETEKLRVLLPHWIEHNGEHAAEFRDYAGRSGKVKDRLLAAALLLEEANAWLSDALHELGGPLEYHLPICDCHRPHGGALLPVPYEEDHPKACGTRRLAPDSRLLGRQAAVRRSAALATNTEADRTAARHLRRAPVLSSTSAPVTKGAGPKGDSPSLMRG